MRRLSKYRVDDTRLRSFLQAMTGNGLEVMIGTLLLGTFLSFAGVSHPYEYGSLLSIISEVSCFLVNFLNNRMWNRIQFGRRVLEVETNG